MIQQDPYGAYSKNGTEWPTLTNVEELEENLPLGYKKFSFAYPVEEKRYVTIIASNFKSAVKQARNRIATTGYKRIGDIELKSVIMGTTREKIVGYYSYRSGPDYGTKLVTVTLNIPDEYLQQSKEKDIAA